MVKTSVLRLIYGVALALSITLTGAPAAHAGNFEFKAAPQIDLNRVFRVDKSTGQVEACQYGLKDDTVGETLCYKSGDGAGPQPPGEYGLEATRHERDGGVFRINKRDGKMSVCFVFKDQVVCTPPG